MDQIEKYTQYRNKQREQEKVLRRKEAKSTMLMVFIILSGLPFGILMRLLTTIDMNVFVNSYVTLMITVVFGFVFYQQKESKEQTETLEQYVDELALDLPFKERLDTLDLSSQLYFLNERLRLDGESSRVAYSTDGVFEFTNCSRVQDAI